MQYAVGSGVSSFSRHPNCPHGLASTLLCSVEEIGGHPKLIVNLDRHRSLSPRA
jgi:hypothetical protein